MVVGIVYEKNEKTAYPDIVAGSSGIDIRIVFLIQFFGELLIRLKYRNSYNVIAVEFRRGFCLLQPAVEELEKTFARIFVREIVIKFTDQEFGIYRIFHVGETDMLHIAEEHLVGRSGVIYVYPCNDSFVIFA